MAKPGKPIPDGYSTVTPHLVIKDAAKAIAWYEKAFGAEVLSSMPTPDGMIMHAEIKIGNAVLMIVDDMPPMNYWVSPQRLNGTTVGLALYVEDADAWYERAVNAGAEVSLPLMDAFWGDRYGKVRDPFGHEWEIATHKEDLTLEEINERAKAFFENLGGPEPEQ